VTQHKRAIKVKDAEIRTMTENVAESLAARKKLLSEYREGQRLIDKANGELSKLRLTLEERLAYISEVEATSQQKDTEIGLLRMEIESLTLWRENVNQQLRTEADIAAAKSQVLQGRSADHMLERLIDVDNKKDARM
jgi:chromosome segregation ATPase